MLRARRIPRLSRSISERRPTSISGRRASVSKRRASISKRRASVSARFLAGALAAAALTSALQLRTGIAIAAAAPHRVSPGSGSSRWSRPFRIVSPVALDILPAQIGFSATGAAAIALGVHDADLPAVSAGFVVLRSARGRLGGLAPVPGARSILDLSSDRSGLALLTGSSLAGALCCTSAQVIALTSAGSLSRATTVIGHLTGTVAGRVLALNGGRTLATITSDSGVWATQSSPAGRFAAPRRLTPAGDQPKALAATVLSGGDRSAVAWTAGDTSGGSAPRRIFVATGSRLQAPRRGRAAVTVPAGHGVEELGLVPRRGVATAAWIESSYSSSGRYRSRTVVADLDHKPRAHPFTVTGEDASGLSVASGRHGDQALAWKTCGRSEKCTVRVACRPAGGRFGATRALGAIDASQTPVAAVAPNGAVLVGWIAGGRVLASGKRSANAAFDSPHAVSLGRYAHDLALRFGPRSEAIAAWTEGTLSPSLLGAVYPAA